MKPRHFSICLLLFFISFYSYTKQDQGYKEIQCELTPIDKSPSLISPDRKNVSIPRLPFTFGTSTNWSGYATANNLSNPELKSVKHVHGTWTVPQLSPSSIHTYCSIWVGIDGYSSQTVEQIGTEHDWNNGHQRNYAWFEMYPRNAFLISNFPLSVGDVISASVHYQGNDTFILKITNRTKKVHATVPTQYTKLVNAKRNSAEWIVEAPFLNKILPLANFNTIQFRNCWCIIDNIKSAINNHGLQTDRITMITPKGIRKSSPSNLKTVNNESSFKVTWHHQ